MSDYSAIRQKLAAIEHERWAEWQHWVHAKGKVVDVDGVSCLAIPFFPYINNWNRQIKTTYTDLTDKEKASDLEQVDRYWPLIEELIAKAEVAGRIDEVRNAKVTVMDMPKEDIKRTIDDWCFVRQEEINYGQPAKYGYDSATVDEYRRRFKS